MGLFAIIMLISFFSWFILIKIYPRFRLYPYRHPLLVSLDIFTLITYSCISTNVIKCYIKSFSNWSAYYFLWHNSVAYTSLIILVLLLIGQFIFYFWNKKKRQFFLLFYFYTLRYLAQYQLLYFYISVYNYKTFIGNYVS